MIQTKIELAKMVSAPWENCELLYKRRLRKLMRMPDHLFIEIIEKEINYKLEPIRKNTYIVAV